MGRLSFPAYLACGCSGDAEVYWTSVNGNVSGLCARHADMWLDDADNDPALEPLRVTWVDTGRTLHRPPEVTAAGLTKTQRRVVSEATRGGWSPPLWIIPWGTRIHVRSALDLFGITEGTSALTPYGERVREALMTMTPQRAKECALRWVRDQRSR